MHNPIVRQLLHRISSAVLEEAKPKGAHRVDMDWSVRARTDRDEPGYNAIHVWIFTAGPNSVKSATEKGALSPALVSQAVLDALRQLYGKGYEIPSALRMEISNAFINANLPDAMYYAGAIEAAEAKEARAYELLDEAEAHRSDGERDMLYECWREADILLAQAQGIREYAQRTWGDQ